MPDFYTVSFFGHRDVMWQSRLEERLDELVLALLHEQAYVEFLVGRDGTFDQLVSSVIRHAQRAYRSDNSSHVWVMPYPRQEYYLHMDALEDYYDRIEIYPGLAGTHFKAAFGQRNRHMIDRSDLVVCFVEHPAGGAYQALRYAEKQQKAIVNLAEKRRW